MEVERGLLENLTILKEMAVNEYRQGKKNHFGERNYNKMLKYAIDKYMRKEGLYETEI